MPIALVCFDLGGVLVRHRRNLEEVWTVAGLAPPDPTWLEASGFRDALTELAHGHESGRLTTEAFVRAVAEASAGRLDEHDVRRLHAVTVGEQLPGVQAVVERLIDAGVRVAVLSNNNPVHWPLLTGGDYPAISLIPERLASHELGRMKPDPAIFREAARRFAVSPAEVLLLDDSATNVEAARAEGWQAALIDPDAATAPQIERALRDHAVPAFV